MTRFAYKRIFAVMLLTFGVLSFANAEVTRVLLTTNLGKITLEVDSDNAPQTVNNFLRYVKEGFYTGTVFHRVIRGFMIQGGGFGSDYSRKPTHDPIKNEADNGLQNKRGTIAMARTSNPHSATAQFFINHVDNPYLDFKSKDPRGWGYTVFGRVVEGMDVVDKIAEQPTGARAGGMQNVPKDPVIIEEAKIVTQKTN